MMIELKNLLNCKIEVTKVLAKVIKSYDDTSRFNKMLSVLGADF